MVSVYVACSVGFGCLWGALVALLFWVVIHHV